MEGNGPKKYSIVPYYAPNPARVYISLLCISRPLGKLCSVLHYTTRVGYCCRRCWVRKFVGWSTKRVFPVRSSIAGCGFPSAHGPVLVPEVAYGGV